MTDISLPEKFAHLEQYVEEWSIGDEEVPVTGRHQ